MEKDNVKDETCGTCVSYAKKSSEGTGFECVDEFSPMYNVSADTPECEYWSKCSEQMIFQRKWGEFQTAGLLWFVNRILHVFGWAIVVVVQEEPDGTITGAYPARCKFRGFDTDTETKKFEQVARFMRDNGKELYDEAEYDPPDENDEQ